MSSQSSNCTVLMCWVAAASSPFRAFPSRARLPPPRVLNISLKNNPTPAMQAVVTSSGHINWMFVSRGVAYKRCHAQGGFVRVLNFCFSPSNCFEIITAIIFLHWCDRIGRSSCFCLPHVLEVWA